MDVTDDMQRQAKALADPSRFALFRHIAEAGRPVGVAELTELLGFNHNAIRQHLAVLTDAGLVAEGTEQRKTRGRPRKQYSPRVDALSAFRSVSGSYQRLAALLLQVASSDRQPFEVGYEAARAEADDPAPDADHDEVTHGLLRQLAADGFEPLQTGDGRATLMNCPFADVASEGPNIVCELHQGLISGFLADRDETLTAQLTPRDPHQAGCLVTIETRVKPAEH